MKGSSNSVGKKVSHLPKQQSAGKGKVPSTGTFKDRTRNAK